MKNKLFESAVIALPHPVNDKKRIGYRKEFALEVGLATLVVNGNKVTHDSMQQTRSYRNS